MLSTLLELVGLALVVVAGFILSPVVGFVAAGGALVLVGWWLER